jgi:hypothetical protein
MTMDIVEALELWLAEHCTEPMSVTFMWPSVVVSGREVTPADQAEAERLANEQWWIEIRPVSA